MPPIAWSAFSDREIPTELCVSLPSFSCMQMQCMSEFYPNLNLHTSKPTLSPRVVATGGHAGHRVWLVVARCRQATATCIGISGGWAGPPLPTSRPAHHSSSLTAGETDLEGPPPASGTRTHRPQPPQNGPRRPAVPFGHSTTHCGQPSLPGRCGRPGRATTLLSVAARCGPAPPIMVATATRRRRGRHNPPQPHRCGAARPVESRPPHTAVKPQKSVQRCSHEHDQR